MSLEKKVVAQFRRPHGPLGHLAGAIMANRPSNVDRNFWTLDQLELSTSDRVLEVGFGPGVAIGRASSLVSEGMIVGIDHSESMLRQAARRNATAIGQGRVRLYRTDAKYLPAGVGPFNKIYSVNVVQFWPDPVPVFRKLRGALASGGTIATTYMPRHRGATSRDAHEKARKIAMHYDEAGFSSIRHVVWGRHTVPAICVLATV